MKGISVSLLVCLFLTASSFAQVTDINKNDYPTVKIGEQLWMATNLDASYFRDGTLIPHVRWAEDWVKAGEEKRPAWCYVENDEANEKKFGKLYNWYAINHPRGLAPKGWHIPTDEEWVKLTFFLGGEKVAGKKMKSTSNWGEKLIGRKPEFNGTNSSGFNGLHGGLRSYAGRFYDFEGASANWWTSTVEDKKSGLGRSLSLSYINEKATAGNQYKSYGLSVRCIMNAPGSPEEKEQQENDSKYDNDFFADDADVDFSKVMKNIDPGYIFPDTVVRDKDNKMYNILRVESQSWMKENLDVSHFENGDLIPEAGNAKEWEKAAKNQTPAWCYYDNTTANGKAYGKLYNWYAVNDPRGLAPKGWHVATQKDLSNLLKYMGTNNSDPDIKDLAMAGRKMISVEGWSIGHDGDNGVGFSGSPGGTRSAEKFQYKGELGAWWTSTVQDDDKAFFYMITGRNGKASLGILYDDMKKGYSVRCVED